jgi:glycosyltransferase involved in cell wall biosynthesis
MSCDDGASLAGTRLIYLGPRLGVGGVGDYAEQFVEAVTPEFAEVLQYRHGAPGDDGIADLRRHRRAVRALIDEALSKGPVIVHAEISGGALVPFWATAGVRDVPVTVTAHDPPELIWWPARTRFMAHHKILNHGVHFPLHAGFKTLQRKIIGDRTVFVLTESGTRAISAAYPRARAVHVPHFVPDRPVGPPLTERPRAVGFFGLIYRGKGIEQITRIRTALPDDILIRIAGRGTESLPLVDGIDVVGGIDGAEEDAFFGSVRAIVMPYGRRSFYGNALPASGVAARAFAYRTPVVCTDHGSLADMDEQSGAVVLAESSDPDATAAGFAQEIAALVEDERRLAQLGKHVESERLSRSPAQTAKAFCRMWSEVVDPGVRRA